MKRTAGGHSNGAKQSEVMCRVSVLMNRSSCGAMRHLVPHLTNMWGGFAEHGCMNPYSMVRLPGK